MPKKALKKVQTYYLYSDGTISIRRPGAGVSVHMVCHAPNRSAAKKLFEERESRREIRGSEAPQLVPSSILLGENGPEVVLPHPSPSNRMTPIEVAEFSQPGISLSIMGVTLWLAAGNHISVRANGEILIVPAVGPSATDRMLRERDPATVDLPAAVTPLAPTDLED